MTAAEQVERVARALHADACNDGACYHTPGEWVRDARVAIAAMQPAPVTNECAVRASELDTFVRFAKRLYPSSFVPRAVTIADLEEHAARHRRGTCDHPTLAPQAEVLHITGPSETGDLAPMLCGITKVVETPRSPEQPVCQACSAIQMSERNDLDQRAKAQADVLAEIRELHSPSERASGLACSECSAEMDVPHPCETILIIDEHEAKS